MNLEEAKKIYLKYDGLTFGMAREELDKYEEYRELDISNSTKEEWDNEILETFRRQLKCDGAVEIFNKMYNLSEKQHSKEKLMMLKHAMDDVKFEDLEEVACFSETILGRKVLSVRSGMIFWAYDIGEPKIAKELLIFVLDLLNSQEIGADLVARYDRDRKECYEIAAELNINIP